MREFAEIVDVAIAGVKNLLRDKSNRITLLLLIGFLLTWCSQYQINQKINNTNADIERKINHRYYCLLTSLAEIHKTDLDKEHGWVVKNGRRAYSDNNGYFLIYSPKKYLYVPISSQNRIAAKGLIDLR